MSSCNEKRNLMKYNSPNRKLQPMHLLPAPLDLGIRQQLTQNMLEVAETVQWLDSLSRHGQYFLSGLQSVQFKPCNCFLFFFLGGGIHIPVSMVLIINSLRV